MTRVPNVTFVVVATSALSATTMIYAHHVTKQGPQHPTTQQVIQCSAFSLDQTSVNLSVDHLDFKTIGTFLVNLN